MRFLAAVTALAAKFFRRSQTADAMDEELRAHIQLRADDLQRSGLTRAEAERRSRIEFGAYERYREESHEALGGATIEIFLQDLRLTLRQLRRSPASPSSPFSPWR